ncbi:MAG: SDR family oxidoreductase [Candidatus Hydrogenedentota bacterium]|nr:MAG: SDR family oxidoreductase [Candidatus Hydrogenedentota bacterium]
MMRCPGEHRPALPVAYITGASRGLGLAIARSLEGRYALGLGYRTTAPPNLADSLPLPGDVQEKATAETAVAELRKRFGRLDLFIANAGIVARRLTPTTTLEDWNTVWNTNVTGIFYGLQAVEASLFESGGQVVVIGSRAGICGAVGAAAYAAAKAALVGLVRSVAREWAGRARINLLLPPYMDTDMGLSDPRARERARSEHLMHCPGSILDTVRVLVAIIETKTVTGQIFSSDGRITHLW